MISQVRVIQSSMRLEFDSIVSLQYGFTAVQHSENEELQVERENVN